jgi:hypothetical protein
LLVLWELGGREESQSEKEEAGRRVTGKRQPRRRESGLRVGIKQEDSHWRWQLSTHSGWLCMEIDQKAPQFSDLKIDFLAPWTLVSGMAFRSVLLTMPM